jgi:hypothetical protein
MGLSSIATNVGRTKKINTDIADIITFIESDWGLQMRLFPVQKVILKAHYGLPLEDKVPTINLSDWRRESFRKMTEAEYLQYLYDEGRCNIAKVEPGKQRREMILSIGRRSGKTTISACIAAYETYKLISKGDPQGYYGLPHSNNIQIISVATDKDQAGLLYQEVSGHYRNCSFFSPYTANNTQSYARFQTPKDIERTGSYIDDPTAKATLKITFRSCVAKGLRGAGNIVVILDEVAHFTDKGQSGAEAVYNAVTPSTSAFSQKDPNDSRVPVGPVEGRIISISSPLGRQGQFYKLFSIAMQGGRASENMLAIQAPTWEVNPTVPASEFEKHYIKDTTVFFTEYGGEFTDRTRGWLEDPRDLMECVDPKLKPRTQGRARQPHFLGLDLGLVGDGTAVAIGHIESRDGENKIVLDYVEQIKAGEGEYAHLDRLEFDDVAQWVYDLTRKFYITEGLFDQWAGIPFEQALQKKGLKQLKSEHFTKNKTSEIYKNFKDMMWDKKLVLYDHPIPDGQEHCGYIAELMELQATKHSKYIVTVEAPNMKGKHDDRSDALVRMVWLASQNLGNSSYISKGGRGGVSLSQKGAYISQSAKLRRTGSHSSRQAPKGRRR